MSKVVVTEYITLDGVIEDPTWTGPFWNDEIAKFKFDELFASDALLLGRVTYQGFAQAWPSMTDEQGFANRMNSMPKFVASRTLDTSEWNATVIKGDVATQVATLKQQPAQNMLVYGSGELVHTLMQNNLVDEYRLLVYPVVRGSGKRLFKETSAASLKLVETQPFSSGVVALIYQPQK